MVLMPEEVLEMHVADTGRYITLSIVKPNRKDVRDLTGYAGWISFWYDGSAPHVKRAAVVDPTNGLLIYTLRGDEFTTTGFCYAQGTMQAVDWYGGSAPGRGFISTSTRIVKIKVMRRPS